MGPALDQLLSSASFSLQECPERRSDYIASWMLTLNKESTTVTLACEDGQQVFAPVGLLALASPLFRMILTERKRNMVYLPYSFEAVVWLMHILGSWDMKREVLKLDEERASLLVTLGIVPQDLLLSSMDLVPRGALVNDDEDVEKEEKEEEDDEEVRNVGWRRSNGLLDDFQRDLKASGLPLAVEPRRLGRLLRTWLEAPVPGRGTVSYTHLTLPTIYSV